MKIERINFTQTKPILINGLKNNVQMQTVNSNTLQDTFRPPAYNVVAFTGINGLGKVKQRGMLFHITNLPATRSYCGQFLDSETTDFVKFLADSKQTHWIMNPLFALGNDLCPYNSTGRFSHNKYLVNLNHLTSKEYGNILKPRELPDDVTSPVFNLDMLERQKNPRFEKAFERFKKLDSSHPLKTEYNQFVTQNDKLWLDTYSVYNGLSSKYGDNWRKWDKDLQILPDNARAKGTSLSDMLKNTFDKQIKDKIIDKVELFKFEQFLYEKQFNEFKKQLEDKNIRLILDLAIGVNPNGVDVWANKNIFLLDNKFMPAKVSGCPSESAYPYTQVWNHALYDYDSPDFWNYQEQSIHKLLKEGDLRLDHFVGYINRAEIPVKYTAPDGRVLNGDEIFLPKEKGGLGTGFFDSDWIARVDQKRNSRGENMFELFKRVAREEGFEPEDCYILEDFGSLAKTDAYKEFKEKYGKDFVSQRIPIGKGIGERLSEIQPANMHSPEKIDSEKNIAILTGNHDLKPMRDYIDLLLDGKPKIIKSKDGLQSGKNSPALFREFCKKELKLSDKEIKDRELVLKELMKWHYTRDVKQVQTTLQDALGLYFRPNIPGFWNGMEDKYLMKSTSEGLLHYWSRVFPKGFLNRINKSGINPGYKDRADDYIQMMNRLFPSGKTDSK